MKVSKSWLMRDLTSYPVCIDDEDCAKRHKLQDHVCFQFFCYPWKTTSGKEEAPFTNSS